MFCLSECLRLRLGVVENTDLVLILCANMMCYVRRANAGTTFCLA